MGVGCNIEGLSTVRFTYLLWGGPYIVYTGEQKFGDMILLPTISLALIAYLLVFFPTHPMYSRNFDTHVLEVGTSLGHNFGML